MKANPQAVTPSPREAREELREGSPDPQTPGGEWFCEEHTPNVGLKLRLKGRLHAEQTPFQKLEVLDSFEFGRVMVLDGCVMLTEHDEHIYHEMLTHPALCLHDAPKEVLIIGGGDGGTAREALRHASVAHLQMVELDARVCEVSRQFFPAVAQAFGDPRLEVICRDGFAHLQGQEARYDVILVDSIDPVGPGEKLFSPEFYRLACKALRPEGIFVCQSESPLYHLKLMAQVLDHLQALYPFVTPYHAHIPTYPGGFWSFSLGSRKKDPESPLDALSGLNLSYLNREVFQAAKVFPPCFDPRRLSSRP